MVPTAYGIHRTAGPWVGPDFQQLKVEFNTGIILDPGSGYGKSYVEVVGGGLRVTGGGLGIGTATPHNMLGIRAGEDNMSGLQFERLTGYSPATTGNGKVLSVDNGGNVVLVNDIGGAGTTWALTGNGLTDTNTNFIGTTDAQPLVFRTNNQPRARLQSNGNFLLNKFEDNGMIFQAVGYGSFTGPMDVGTAFWLGDNVNNKVVGINTYGDGAGSNRYTAFGHNMLEAGSKYDDTKQGGGIYLDDRSVVLPIRFMIKKPNENFTTYAGGVAVSGNFLIGHVQRSGRLQVAGRWQHPRPQSAR